MERRRVLRVAAGIAGFGSAGCIESRNPGDSDDHEGTPTPIYLEVTPEETPTPDGLPSEETPEPTETPESTETPEPTETPTPEEPTDRDDPLELESDYWTDEENGEQYLYVDGAVHNGGTRAVEIRVHAAGWYEEAECTDGDPDAPDWEVGPTWQVLVGPGVTWQPPYPWRRSYRRFSACSYESPQVWIVGSELW